MNKALNHIFKMHDDLCQSALFGETDQDRQEAHIKATALRELLYSIRDNVIKPSEQDRFNDAVEAHFAAIGKHLFYKRNLDFER